MSFFLSQMRVAAEVKLILSIQPEQRTEQQLAKVFLLHFASNSIVTEYLVKISHVKLQQSFRSNTTDTNRIRIIMILNDL